MEIPETTGGPPGSRNSEVLYSLMPEIALWNYTFDVYVYLLHRSSSTRAKDENSGYGAPNEVTRRKESEDTSNRVFSDFEHIAKENGEAIKSALASRREQWRGQYSSPRSVRQQIPPHNSLSSSLSGSFTGSLPGRFSEADVARSFDFRLIDRAA